MRLRKNNQAYALLVGIFLAIFLGAFLSAALLSSDIQMKSVRERESAQQAFYAAEAGVEEALFELRRNKDWVPPASATQLALTNIGSAEVSGSYTVQLDDAPIDPNYPTFPAVWVRGDGVDPHTQIRRSILAKVILFNPAQFFVSSLGDFRMGSGSTYQGDLLGRDMYFDVNHSFPNDNDKKIVVDGQVYYFRNVYGDADPFVEFKKAPPQKFTTITFPGVDTTRYRDLAQAGGKYVAGNYNVPLNISKAKIFNDPQDSNGVIFAEGDIYISGQYDDSLLFVAGGDIYLNGSLTATNASSTFPQIGLFAKRDVIVPESAPDDMTVEAFLIADGGGDAYGYLRAEGEKYSKDGTFTFKGAMAVRGLEDDGSAVRTAVDMNVYKTRNYIYNQTLNTQCTIPFMSFVANIVDWKEINPNDTFPPP